MVSAKQVKELIEAAAKASATLSHIYNTTPLGEELEGHALADFQRLDKILNRVSPPKRKPICLHDWATKYGRGGPVEVCKSCGIAR